jgi:predicted RecB family nuclease
VSVNSSANRRGLALQLSDANAALLSLQTQLERGDVAGITEVARATVQSYNRDDCLSAERLRAWL